MKRLLWLVCVSLAVPSFLSAQEPNDAGSKMTSPPKELTVDLGKGVKLEMVLIPAGEFMMGSPDSDKDAEVHEKSPHRVRITRPFYLGKYEVTVCQFRRFVEANRSRTEAKRNGIGGSGWNEQGGILEGGARYT